jgi:hypothetical protein
MSDSIAGLTGVGICPIWRAAPELMSVKVELPTRRNNGDSALNSSFATTTVLNPFRPVGRRTGGLICPMAARPRRPSVRHHHNPLCYPTGKSRMGSVQSSERKYSCFRHPQISATNAPSHPSTRGVGHRRERWGGMRWTRQRRARLGSQGGSSVSGHSAQTNGAVSPVSRKTSVGVHYPPKHLVKLARGRQNRVVLAPVAGVKSAEVLLAQPGSAESLIRRRR